MKIKVVSISVDHPAFSGHFPGNPILPGVSLLDLVIDTYGSAVKEISNAKFLRPVLPGDTLTITIGNLAQEGAKFSVARLNEIVCEGRLVPA